MVLGAAATVDLEYTADLIMSVINSMSFMKDPYKMGLMVKIQKLRKIRWSKLGQILM